MQRAIRPCRRCSVAAATFASASFLAGCGPGPGPSVSSPLDSGSTRASATSSTGLPGGPPPANGKQLGRLFSRDGRYVVLDQLVDLDTDRRVALDCDLASVHWERGARVWCTDPQHTKLVTVDASTGSSRTFPYNGGSKLWLDRSDRFVGWSTEHLEVTEVFNTETAAWTRLPGFADPGLVGFHGGIARVELRGAQAGFIQLWDLTNAKPIGKPYLSEDPPLGVSSDDRWELDFNRQEGQFLVELGTGKRTIVGSPHETSWDPTAFGLDGPFSHDGSHVAVAAMPSGVRVVEVASGVIAGTLVAPGCENPMIARWSRSGDMLVVGGDGERVCAFNALSWDLIWSTPLPASRVSPALGDLPVAHSEVVALEFTVDEKGVVAGTSSFTADSDAVLLRASDGAVIKALGTSFDLIRDQNGSLFAGGFLVGADLKTSPLPLSWSPAEISLEYFADLEAARCASTQFLGPDCEVWKGVTVIDRDPKMRWVLGRSDGNLGVWNAATGERVYSVREPMHEH